MNAHIKKQVKVILTCLLWAVFPLLITGTLFGTGAAICNHVWEEAGAQFSTLQKGSTKDDIISRMGNPSRLEKGIASPASKSASCHGDCAERFFYEFPLCLGLEVWFLDLDKNGNLINKGHWVSP